MWEKYSFALYIYIYIYTRFWLLARFTTDTYLNTSSRYYEY